MKTIVRLTLVLAIAAFAAGSARAEGDHMSSGKLGIATVRSVDGEHVILDTGTGPVSVRVGEIGAERDGSAVDASAFAPGQNVVLYGSRRGDGTLDVKNIRIHSGPGSSGKSDPGGGDPSAKSGKGDPSGGYDKSDKSGKTAPSGGYDKSGKTGKSDPGGGYDKSGKGGKSYPGGTYDKSGKGYPGGTYDKSGKGYPGGGYDKSGKGDWPSDGGSKSPPSDSGKK